MSRLSSIGRPWRRRIASIPATLGGTRDRILKAAPVARRPLWQLSRRYIDDSIIDYQTVTFGGGGYDGRLKG